VGFSGAEDKFVRVLASGDIPNVVGEVRFGGWLEVRTLENNFSQKISPPAIEEKPFLL
jgi:hypothetical protein